MSYAAFSVVFGEQPSAAKWNILGTNDSSFNDGTGIANLEVGNVTAVKNDYKFSYSVAAFATSSSLVIIKFGTSIYDTGANYSASTGLFTAPKAGFYFFNFSGFIGVSNSGNNISETHIFKNGSDYRAINDNSCGTITGGNLWVGGTALLSLALSDTVAIYNKNTFSTGLTGVFEGTYISTT